MIKHCTSLMINPPKSRARKISGRGYSGFSHNIMLSCRSRWTHGVLVFSLFGNLLQQHDGLLLDCISTTEALNCGGASVISMK